MRFAVAAIAVVASAAAGNAQAVTAPAVYREAVGKYIRTGDTANVVKAVAGWDWSAIDLAVADIIKSQDAGLIEAAAVLHLEIGVAIVGMSTASSLGYFERGAQLIDSIVPINPDVRKALSAQRLDEIAKVR
jgi:hypothetical protein